MTASPASQSTPKSEYWCFISYRHADNRDQGRQWATWLHQQIETYEVPSDLVGTTNERGDVFPERIFPVFRDEDELPADADLASPIYRALDRSKFLVVLCSPQAAGSAYVAAEIQYFKQIGKSGRVLAALIDGEPNASWDLGKQRAGFDAMQECFPKSLQHPVDAAGGLIETERAEPIAADFRLPTGGQGWTTPEAYRQSLRETGDLSTREIDARVSDYRKRSELAKLKIIAGILGIPLGQLTQRDKAYQLEKARRRARVLWRVSLAMIALAALALIAGAFALKRENDARKAKATSDDLSEFMIVDLYERLIPIGRTDLLDEAASRLEKNLGTGTAPTEKPDCLRYLRLKFQVAKIRLAQGRISEAYQIAAGTSRGIPANLAADREVSLAVADLQSLASDMAIRIGEPEGEQLALDAVNTFRRNGQAAPLTQALVNLMDYHLQRQELETARKLGEEAVDQALVAVENSPAPEARETLLRILLRKSRFEAEQRKFPEALAVLAERSSYLATFSKDAPDHWLWDREKILNGIEESKLQLKLNNAPRAAELAENSLRDALVLESRDPSNLEWCRMAATSFNHRAFIKLALKQAPDAKADFEQGLARFKKLTGFSPRNLGWRSSLAWNHDGLRSALVEMSQPEAAIVEAVTCTRLLRSVYEDLGKPAAAEATRELMMALITSANLQTDLLDLNAAAGTIQEAVDLAEKLAAPTTLSLSDAILGSDILFTQSEILAAKSQPQPALASARKARSFLEKAAKPGRHLAAANLKVASLEAESAQTAEARQSLLAAISILEGLSEPSPQTTRDLETARSFLANLPR